MQCIAPRVSEILEPNPLKKVELIGRTCYKSEDKITDNSCYKFVDNLAKRTHFAMLEHAEITYEITGCDQLPDEILHLDGMRWSRKVIDSKQFIYMTVSLSHIYKDFHFVNMQAEDIWSCVCTLFKKNYIDHWTAVSVECKNSPIKVRILRSFRDILGFDEHDLDIHGSYTLKFFTDRGVSHELVRHRCSVAQESTRYCCYAKSKFGGHISYIIPSTIQSWPDEAKELYYQEMQHNEEVYMKLVNDYGLTAQQARCVLNNSLKAEVILTMPVYRWKHFFDMRDIGTSGSPHPDMVAVAHPGHELFNSWMKSQEKYFN